MRFRFLAWTAPKRALIALAAITTVVHGNAAAQATGWSYAYNYRYSLTDLDPDDGITPAINWIATSPAGATSYYGQAGGATLAQGTAPFAKHWLNGVDTMSAWIEGHGAMATTLVAVSSTSLGTPPYHYNNLVSAFSPGNVYTLTPGTGITFQIDYEFSALVINPASSTDSARAFAYISGYLAGGTGDGFVWAETSSTNGDISRGTVTSYAANLSDEMLRGYSGFGAEVYTRFVPTVPEPSAWLMTGAGVALLALRRKRG